MALHELSDTLFAHADASGHQFFPHLGPAVFLLDLGVDGLDVHQQRFVANAFVGTCFTGLGAAFAMPVFKVATGADLQHLAGQCGRPLDFMFGNPRVLHSDSRAKYAVAFFKMSRSIVTRANCARSRASSICSGETGWSPAPLS